MSGAETIAGLALAAPPLIISWMEHHRELSEMIGTWKRFREKYRQVKTQLDSLEISINLTFDELFLDLVDSVDELRRLKKDRKNKSWADIEAKLKQRLLPDIQQCYGSLLKALQTIIDDLQKLLAHENPLFLAEVKADATTSKSKDNDLMSKAQRRVLYEVERIKFSTRLKPIEETIQKLAWHLDRMRNLLSQNDTVAERRAAHSRKKSETALNKVLLQFWRHAHAVYKLITRSWTCPCHTQHAANLLLLHRTSAEIQLDILLQSRKTHSGAVDQQWTTQRVRMQRKELDMMRGDCTTSSVTPSNSSNMTVSSLPLVANLCQAFRHLPADQVYVGLLAEKNAGDGYSVTIPAGLLGAHNNSESITLGSLLRRSLWERPDRKTRYRIAAILASSHLQLHCSEWLPNGWNRDDVVFLVQGGEPDTGQPYLRRRIAETMTTSTPAFDISFSTLAIVLLELCFGCQLEDSPFRKKHLLPDGSSDLVQDRAAAWEWASMVEGEADEYYARAVDWCLNRWRVRTEEIGWRQEFVRVVVEPLITEAGLK